MKIRLLLAAVLLPCAALAHPGLHHEAPPAHLLTQADHLATVAMIAALAAAGWLLLRGRP